MKGIWLRLNRMRGQVSLHRKGLAVVGFGHETTILSQHLARGEWFIAQCVQVDVASQGATEDEALENLQDALELHFSPPVATRKKQTVNSTQQTA
jgi:hypothetical protein